MKETDFKLENYMDKIVEEVVFTTPSQFDTLLFFVDKLCKARVEYLCFHNDALKSGGFEDDIMQNIRCRVVKYSERNFFCRADREGVNNNPAELKKWLSTVTTNCVKDCAKKVRKRRFKETDEDEAGNISVFPKNNANEYVIDKIYQSLDIVIFADVKIYKTLCWIAMAEFMIVLNATKIKVTDLIVEKFSDMPLEAMYSFLKKTSSYIPWINISENQDMHIREKLNALNKEGKRFGSLNFGSFYMEKGAKKSISDWLNRMNSLVKKKVIK